MRRTSLILIALFVGLVVAAPAFAQGRDPFDPQPGEQDQSQGGSGSGQDDPFDPEEGEQPSTQPTSQPDDPTEPVADPTEQPAPSEVDRRLARTGFDVSTWTGVAYLLIVLGAAALVAGRLFAPAVGRHRRK